MMNIILFGPPGSGKGTQAAKLKEHFNLLHISTGDLLRDEISRSTTLGLEAKQFMDAGKLVPDSVVIGMISNTLDEASKQGKQGIIFDGFPRTVAQAEALDKLLQEKESKIDGVLSLEVDEEELTKRILQRGLTSGRSDDTDEETIRKRVMEYREKTEPVAAHYRKQNLVKEIEGTGSIDSIFNDLVSATEIL
ncbi:MAG TPA: adenylate kinase [Chitinophagales bacterium]|nr:adenylate kinase [Chitinophagales bacterium]